VCDGRRYGRELAWAVKTGRSKTDAANVAANPLPPLPPIAAGPARGAAIAAAGAAAAAPPPPGEGGGSRPLDGKLPVASYSLAAQVPPSAAAAAGGDGDDAAARERGASALVSAGAARRLQPSEWWKMRDFLIEDERAVATRRRVLVLHVPGRSDRARLDQPGRALRQRHVVLAARLAVGQRSARRAGPSEMILYTYTCEIGRARETTPAARRAEPRAIRNGDVAHQQRAAPNRER
jgi:hypothetical protein